MKNKKNNIKIIGKKKRKSYITRKYMLYYIFFIIVFIITIFILCLTVFFNIDEIEISGKTNHKKQEILKASGIKHKDNLFLTNSKKAEKKIFETFKDLDFVHILKTFPNKISIECNDSLPSFYVKKDNKNLILVSKNNRIIKTNAQSPFKNTFLLVVFNANVEKFKDGDYFELEKDEQKKFNIIKETIENENAKNITKVEIQKDQIKIIFENRVVLEIDEFDNIKYLLNLAIRVLKSVIGKSEKGRLIYIKHKKALHFIPNASYALN